MRARLHVECAADWAQEDNVGPQWALLGLSRAKVHGNGLQAAPVSSLQEAQSGQKLPWPANAMPVGWTSDPRRQPDVLGNEMAPKHICVRKEASQPSPISA